MQGRGSAESLRDISDPEGKIFLSYMNLRMVDIFSPTFRRFIARNVANFDKTSMTSLNVTFYSFARV